MADPIVVVDTSDVRQGALDELEAALVELVGVVEAYEDGPLVYSVHFDEAGARMTVVQVHASSASMEAHLRAAAPVFARLAGLVTLRRVDFYGTPSAELLDRMREKATLLGGAAVAVNPLHAGFLRLLPARDEDSPTTRA